jgi:hypothetical protein
VVASDDPEKAYLEAYAVARQAADAVDGLVGKLTRAASNFDRGRWKRFDRLGGARYSEGPGPRSERRPPGRCRCRSQRLADSG